MPDRAESFLNAWLQLWGQLKCLYCSRHVDRAWQKNLPTIKDLEKRKQMYKN